MNSAAGLLDTVTANLSRLREACGALAPLDPDLSRRWVAALKQGRILFYGRDEVQIGLRGIDWSGPHVAHQEWPAQLNRFFWLPHLAAVYRETGDEQLPAMARATIEDWMDQHSYAADRPLAQGDNTLNLSIRLGQGVFPGWWGTAADFARSRAYDASFVERMRESTRGQLAYLAAHLSAAGNWRISHLDCLLYCGLAVPGLEEHVPFAVRHLNEAFLRQIHDDGSHEEHNPSYHLWMCRLFSRLWRLARARPDLGLRLDTRKAARMWDYAVHAAAPDGGSCGLHDSQVWTPRQGPAVVPEERGRFLGEAGLADEDEFNLARRPSRFFPCAGQLFLRDDWSAEAMFVFFDATRWGGGHCHLSRLAVGLHAGGRMLLYDPGIFSYEMSDPCAVYGKSTPAHNTIALDGLSQTECNPDTWTVWVEDTFAVIASRYEGGYFGGPYTWTWRDGKGPGLYGAHERVMVWLRQRCVLVFDRLRCDAGARYAAHWQMPAGARELDAPARRAWTRGAGANVLVQCLESPPDCEGVIHEGRRDPLLGWLPDEARRVQPAPLFSLEGRAGPQPVELVTLLLPFRGDALPAFSVERFRRDAAAAHGFRLRWPDGTEDVIAASPALRTQVDRSGPVSTDGCLAAVRLESGRVRDAFLLDGLFLDYMGSRLIEAGVPGRHRTRA